MLKVASSTHISSLRETYFAVLQDILLFNMRPSFNLSLSTALCRLFFCLPICLLFCLAIILLLSFFFFVSLFLCFFVSLFLCFFVSLFLCFFLSFFLTFFFLFFFLYFLFMSFFLFLIPTSKEFRDQIQSSFQL